MSDASPEASAPPRTEHTSTRPEAEEVRRRLGEGRPFHLATGLAPPAIDQAPQALEAHLDLPVAEQQRLLAEALVARGIAEPIARAVASVPRHLLVPSEHRRRAYLDEFHAVHGWSGLTPPSLVAEMLARLEIDPQRPGRVLELGAGSAFHALALLRLAPGCRVVGVEVERDLVERARAAVERLGVDPGALTLIHGDGPEAAHGHGPFDRVFATFAVRSPAARALPALRDGGLALIPRCLTPHELAREPLLASLRDEHPTYESLLGDWQRHLCLTTYRRRGDRLEVTRKLFGVSFVGERSGDH